ncbi:Glycolipid transfer protein 1 isoform 4, partial [Theobroma cacao]
MEGTVFTPSLEGMQHIKSPQGEMLTKPFLEVCKLVLPVIDKFGTAMTLVKSDIGGNISRLEKKYQSDTTKYNYLYNMVKEEVECKTVKGSSSCTNGLLWLTRAMDFLVELFRNLLAHPDWTMAEACTDSYGKTLKKFHGWIASSSFT